MEFHGAGTVVTGASGGIGEALARRFHHLGASVVVSDVVEDGITNLAVELNAKRPNSMLAVTADVSTEKGNEQLVATARQFLSQNGGSQLQSPTGIWRSMSTFTPTAGRPNICLKNGSRPDADISVQLHRQLDYSVKLGQCRTQ